MSEAAETSTTPSAPVVDTAPSPAETSGAAAASVASTGDAPARDVAGDAVAQARAADEAAARKWRLKVDGKEHEVASEEELLTLAQKGLGADRRFEEAASQRKEAAQFRQQIEAAARRMAEEPLEVLSALYGDEGRAAQIAAERVIKNPRARQTVIDLLLSDPDARALAEQRMLEQIQYESLPEEERRKIDEDRSLRARAKRADELEAVEKKRSEDEAQRKAREREAAEEQRARQTFAEEAKTSLTAVGLDPADPDVLERWAMHRMAALEHGVEMTAAEAAKRVADQLGRTRKATIDGLAQLEGDALLGAIPKAVLDKIRAADAARIRGGQRAAARAAQTGKASGAPRRSPEPKREYTTESMLRGYRKHGVEETKRRMRAGEPL